MKMSCGPGMARLRERFRVYCSLDALSGVSMFGIIAMATVV